MRTWNTRPTNDRIRDVRKMARWAFMIGMARRSHDRDLSGSMPEGGASLRASTAMGTNSVPVSAGPLGRGRSVRAFIAPTGPASRPPMHAAS